MIDRNLYNTFRIIIQLHFQPCNREDILMSDIDSGIDSNIDSNTNEQSSEKIRKILTNIGSVMPDQMVGALYMLGELTETKREKIEIMSMVVEYNTVKIQSTSALSRTIADILGLTNEEIVIAARMAGERIREDQELAQQPAN